MCCRSWCGAIVGLSFSRSIQLRHGGRFGRGENARSGIIGLTEALVKGGIDTVSGLEFGGLVVMVVFVWGRKERLLDALGEGKESDEDQRDRAESGNPRTKGQTEASDAQAQRKQRRDGACPESVHDKRTTERITCGGGA